MFISTLTLPILLFFFNPHHLNPYDKSSYSSYINLKANLSLISRHSKEYKEQLVIVLRALAKSYEFKLNANIYNVIYRKILNLFQAYNKYHDSIKRSSLCLNSIQKSLQRQCSLKLTSYPVFAHLENLDAEKEKKRLEEWVGKPICFWGDTELSWQEIEQQLLSNLESKSDEVFEDFKRCFQEHFT